MNVWLLFQDRDPPASLRTVWNEADLVRDLQLEPLLRAMAGGDEFLHEAARRVLFSQSEGDPVTIRFRQEILGDCLREPGWVRRLYRLLEETEARRKERWFGFFCRTPSAVLDGSVRLLSMYLDVMVEVRALAREGAVRCSSPGLGRLMAQMEAEFADEVIGRCRGQIAALGKRGGTFVSAGLGLGNEGRDFVVHRLGARGPGLFRRLIGGGRRALTFRLHERDEAGARIVDAWRNRALAGVAGCLARAVEHVRSFCEDLRGQLGFYVGCLNLHERLVLLGEPTCFPRAGETEDEAFSFTGLYEPCLALETGGRVVGTTLEGDGRRLLVVTGASRGGKTVFLRSLGLAHLMMGCGMFVAAESFAGPSCRGIHTHFRREEDPSLRSGKLDEELSRMSTIVDNLGPESVVLLNESFASTNEREGSEIARHVVLGLVERGVRVVFVTHLNEFARGLFDEGRGDTLFLRAEPEGRGRAFELAVGGPLRTSFGDAVYRRVFGEGPQDSSGPPRLQRSGDGPAPGGRERVRRP